MNKSMSIEDTIEETVDEFGENPYNINDGLCDRFAATIRRKIPQARDRVAGNFFEGEAPAKYWGHVWIFYEGKHYDAECPEGVDDWKDLPFYKRKQSD